MAEYLIVWHKFFWMNLFHLIYFFIHLPGIHLSPLLLFCRVLSFQIFCLTNKLKVLYTVYMIDVIRCFSSLWWRGKKGFNWIYVTTLKYYVFTLCMSCFNFWHLFLLSCVNVNTPICIGLEQKHLATIHSLARNQTRQFQDRRFLVIMKGYFNP